MEAAGSNRTRVGAAALGLAALLFAAFPLVRPFFDVPEHPSPEQLTAIAQTLSSGAWVASHVLLIVALILLIFGMLALYAYLANSQVERRAFLALVLNLVGIGLLLPIAGIEAFALRALGQVRLMQSQLDLFTIVGTIYGGPGTPTLLLSLVFLAVGSMLFALAIWQSRMLPRWAGILLALGLALFLPLFPQLIRIIDGFLIGVGGLWLAWSMWAHASQATMRKMHITSSV